MAVSPLGARLPTRRLNATERLRRLQLVSTPPEATSLFEKLDSVVYQNPSAWRFHAEFPAGNVFAAELGEVLEHHESYRLGSHPVFGGIDDQTAEAFASFCREPESWQRFLHSQGVRSFVQGPDGRFFRSAAYQCAKHFPKDERRLQRLVESAYAATYCDRERSEGRYGGPLIELPYRFASAAEQQDAAESLIKVEVAPTGAVAQVPIMPGVASVIARTRESVAYANLRRMLDRLGTGHHLPLEAEFRSSWLGVSEVYAQELAASPLRLATASGRVTTYSVWAYLLARVSGLIAIQHGPFGLETGVAIDHAVEHYVPLLVQGFRGLWQVPKVRESLVKAAKIRCSLVVPNTGAREKRPAPDRRTPNRGSPG